MRFKARFFLLILICFSVHSAAGDVYKYKDQNGNWVFTDKAPSGSKKIDNIKVAQTQVTLPAPKVYGEVIAGRFYLFAENLIHSPIQIEVSSPSNLQKKISYLLGPKELATIHEGAQELKNLKVAWQLGDHRAHPEEYLYRVPIGSNEQYIVSQGFAGEFSHFNEHSKFAIDITMDIGTEINAARAGTVMWVKDDSYVGGSDPSYMSKANFVAVLHDDGSYATYLHLLGGSAYVRAGEAVEVGDRLAKSGASGYTTGPHLHFVVQRNGGMKTVSLPFQFAGTNGEPITPAQGMKLSSDLRKATTATAEGNGNLNSQTEQATKPSASKPNGKQCENARINYIILAQDMPVYIDRDNQYRAQSNIDYYQGKRIALNDEQRATEISKVKREIVSACDNPNDNEVLKELSAKWLRQEHCAKARYDLDQLKRPEALTPNDVVKRKQQSTNDICSGKTPLSGSS